jgi:hypothetical protein
VPFDRVAGDHPLLDAPEDLDQLLGALAFARQHALPTVHPAGAAPPDEDILAGLTAEERAVVRRLLADAAQRAAAPGALVERSRP